MAACSVVLLVAHWVESMVEKWAVSSVEKLARRKAVNSAARRAVHWAENWVGLTAGYWAAPSAVRLVASTVGSKAER